MTSFPTKNRSSSAVVAGVILGAFALTGCSATATDTAVAQVREAAVPELTAASATTGSLVGGETLQLDGTDLGGISSVSFGNIATTDVTVLDDSSIAVVVPSAVGFAPGTVDITATDSAGTRAAGTVSYDYRVVSPVDAQMQYAFTYWQDYNLEEWGVFDDNDCGNFVNQTLVARGWQQTDDWFSDWATTGDFSLSWVRGGDMDAWFAANPLATYLSIDQRDQVKIGDVVMFDWNPEDDDGVDHTMIVSAVDHNTGAISLAGHTLDATDRDFDTAITIDNPGGTAHFYSISD